MKIGILGSGSVAKALAEGFLARGDEVMLGTRHPDKLADWSAEKKSARAGSFAEAADFAEVAVLAVKGSAALDAVHLAGAKKLEGKTVLDATNPIEDTEPINGVLNFFTGHHDSLMEELQREFAGVRFVKAFNSVGAPLMVDPKLSGGPPTMFICGNHDGAKKQATEIIEAFGWDVADMGTAEAARAIEPLCMLWCIPGFRDNEWTHAFKLLR